jgi:hypothetical protein
MLIAFCIQMPRIITPLRSAHLMRNILYVHTFFFSLAQDTVSLTHTGTITIALLGINLRIFRQHGFES